MPHAASILSDPGADPCPEPSPRSDIPNIPTRTTIPVPVRSKQRTRVVDDPPPKKKQKSETMPASVVLASSRPDDSIHLPLREDSDDSDAAESFRAASVHRQKGKGQQTMVMAGKARPTPPPAPALETVTTPAIILTPNPNEMAPLPDINDGGHASMSVHSPGAGAPPDPLSRAWTESDDRQLTAMKEDTRSRPSWKSIGARLGRDPQLCKVRWSLLKRTDPEGRINAPVEPDNED